MRTFTFFCAISIFLMISVAASCEFSFLENQPPGGGLSSEDVDMTELQKVGVNTPQNLFSDFLDMVDEVNTFSQSEIDSLNSSEILELGDPIQRATENTIYFDGETLGQLNKLLENLEENFATLSESQHRSFSREIEKILDSGDTIEGKNTHQIREVLKLLSSNNYDLACGKMFNRQENYILLGLDDSFNIANQLCPAGSVFFVMPGTHTGQSVLSSKQGNKWIGLNGAIMDGEDTVYRAFSGAFSQNQIAWIELRNYHLHGIYSTNNPSNIHITRSAFRNIAPDSSGQDYGAIKFDNASNITISHSYFENTASAVRFRFSSGPIEVVENEALNIGRNFFQCDDCSGAGIKINRNSMERTDAYGVAVLEDWINLFKSHGDSTSWIQVNNNRARGHSLSGSGSFIMLGDAGGSYQEAVGNMGVNPGQVGIGVAGGENIKVEANTMFSVPWDSSNVAYYSALYSPSCGNHQFPATDSGASQPNRANWMCGDKFNCHNPPTMNYAWTDEKCGIQLDELRRHVKVDRSIGPDVWNEW
ncbi:MAG: right-handed parallel beta-helix repeat-containing protein [Balneolaceae bacterium]|nr:right-handed parallel beta-helix repeat-containing protein [Balneolaceae bacterium]